MSIVASKGREIRDCSKRINGYDKGSRYDKSVFKKVRIAIFFTYATVCSLISHGACSWGSATIGEAADVMSFTEHSKETSMIIVLRVVGWLGVFLAGYNAGLKLFAGDETLRAFAGSSRSLDLNIMVFAFCLLFLALAKILVELRKLRDDK
ncbi:MAG: hypothetical protein ACI9PY_003732 [Ascidiaceihabitans sp.]